MRKRIISATLIILMMISTFGVASVQDEPEKGTVTAGVTRRMIPKIDSFEIIPAEVDTVEATDEEVEQFLADLERLAAEQPVEEVTEEVVEEVVKEEPVEEVVSDAGAEKVRATFYIDSVTCTGLPHYGTIAGRKCDLGKTVSLYSMDWQYLGEYTFEDIGYGPSGGIVKGTCIDIWFPSEEEGWEFERDYGDYVYIVGR